MGRSIYFTDKELKQIRNYALEAIEILGEASGTWEQTEKDLDDGLGSAMRKLYKGYNGEARFSKYKTVR
mgnify:FL=1|jgi:hypothetical protein